MHRTPQLGGWFAARLHLISGPVLLIVAALACKTAASVSGRWSGKTEMIVEGEKLTHDLSFDLTQAAERVSGRALWGDIELRIVSGDLTGDVIALACDWNGGKMELRGTVMADKIKGRFSARRRNEPEPYRGTFEVVKP